VDRRRASAASLRVVLAIEDVLHALVVALVALLGRREVTVLPFIGSGTPEQVRARGRVVLGRPAVGSAAADLVQTAGSFTAGVRSGAAPTGRPPAGNPPAGDRRVGGRRIDGPPADDRPAGDRVFAITPAVGSPGGGPLRGRVDRAAVRWRTLRQSVAPFLTVELPRAGVRVLAPGGPVVGRCDRQGYLDVSVDAGGLTPGWHELVVSTTWRGSSATVPVPVLVVDPEARLAVISDLDDTVIETGIPRGLEFLRLTLFTSVTERTPLPGAAELYRALTAPRGGPDRPVFYLSTSPWNLYELLARFLVLRGFPAGPMLLTDWGPSRTNLFRITAEQHKLTLIRSLLTEHPGLRVVLVGDTGQLDPEIYAAVATECPGRVRAVYVRRTVGMSSSRALEVGGLVRRVAAAGVPMLMVEDSVQIAEHAAGLGLLDATDVEAVRRASQC
jgi:phosphatidate phosphatase APP1